jgi:hypothetical protein
MDKKKRTQTIVMIVVAGLLAIASCILLIKLIVSGLHELKRWIFFVAAFATAVLFLSGGIKQLKKDKE